MEKKLSPPAPTKSVVADYAGQRLDNYLVRELKGAPRALVCRLIRTGQVRINSRRAKPDTKLQTGDLIRIPPNITLRPAAPPSPPSSTATLPVLFEDAAFLAIHKPAGIAVHGGSGISYGVIEQLRATRQDRFLELVHRLDKSTSGVLLLAKKSSALRAAQAAWRERQVQKKYHTLVFGKWTSRAAHIDLPIKRTPNGIGSRTAADGRPAQTRTSLLHQYGCAALLQADIATGRTHQLRVHLAAVNLPIIGDDKYGDFTANRRLPAQRLFLHATRLTLPPLPGQDDALDIIAPPPPDFSAMQEHLLQNPRLPQT